MNQVMYNQVINAGLYNNIANMNDKKQREIIEFVGDPFITCAINAKVAMESRRPDIAKIWETCEQLVRKQANDYRLSRYNTHKDPQRTLLPHLVITKVLNKIILSLLQGSIVDIQTAAMIICAFTPSMKRIKKYR